MNDIRKTIGWADLSWNPIKGLCPVNCIYCYEKKRQIRLKLDPTIRFDQKELLEPLKKKYKSGTKVFVCSIFDLFVPVADKWRDKILETIYKRPDLTFIILTKMPERIDRPMPENVWLGVSMTGQSDMWRWSELQKHEAVVRFISMEPLIGDTYEPTPRSNWLIVGRLTGHGKKYDPPIEQLSDIYDDCRRWDIPIFMKSNLAGIWPGPLIQE